MPLRKISFKNIIKESNLSTPEDIGDASREERRTTGRAVATVAALGLILLAGYHAWVRKTAVVAGIIVPALIMVLYTAWVLYTARKDKARARQLRLENEMLNDVVVTPPLNEQDLLKDNLNLPILNNIEVRPHAEPEDNIDYQASFHPAILQNQLKPPNLQTRANYGRSISVV